jgi:hypothetical protein
MTQNIYPSQGLETRLVRETSYGVTPGSPTFKRLNGFGVMLGAQVEVNPFAPPGALVPTTPLVNDDYSKGDVKGTIDFNSLPYVISSLLGQATVTSLGGAPAAYQWDWSWLGRRPNRPVSYTIHNGFPESADVATGFIFNTLDLSGGRAKGFDIKGDGFAKALTAAQAMGGITNEVQTITAVPTVSGGTYSITITETNDTASGIAFGANAATVQTALEALATIEPGDILVGGGPLPGTPMTLTYAGVFAGKNVAQATVNSSLLTGGGSYTPSTTTPGADAVVDVPAVPAGAVFGNAYLDTSWAGLGGSQLLYCYDMALKIGDRMSRVRPINKSKSSDGVIDVGSQEHTLKLTLGRNAVADAQLAKLRAGTFVFPRIEWAGDVISGGNNYTFRTDASVFYSDIGMPNDTDNVSTKEFSGRMAIDPVSGNVIAVRVICATASL